MSGHEKVAHQENTLQWVVDLHQSPGMLVSLDKWSATTFSDPLLCLIYRSNSCNNNTQRMSLGLAFFFCNRYLKAAWSI